MTDTPGTSPDELPTGIAPARASRLLTAAEFHRLADVPPEVEWFANLTNPQHPPRLRERGAGLHALRRHRPAGGIPDGDAGPRHRLARRADRARAGRQHHPAPARLAGLAVRISVRQERRDPQPGQRRRAAEDGERRRQDAGDRRSPGPRAAGGPCGRHASRASAIAPSSRPCCSTRCGARNCASSRSRISGTRAKACRISRSPAKAARRAICRCIPAPTP